MQAEARIIVSDLDGTLLLGDKTLSERTRRALLAARAAGIRTAIATARPLRLVDQVLGDAETLFDALIVSNGAAVFHPADRSVLHEVRLGAEESAVIIERIRNRWPHAAFGWELGTRFVSDAAFVELCGRTTILRDPVAEQAVPLPETGVHQLVFAVEGLVPAALVDETAALLGGDYWVTDSHGGVVEISTAAVTKAEGAQWFARSLGLDLSHVVAFGDDLNDVPLLEAAGRGYAMSNAAPHVRAAADAVAATNEEDGVAIVIEELVAQSGAGA